MACCGGAAGPGISVTDGELAGATLVDSHCHLKSACVGGPAVFPMATNEEDWTTWPHEHDDPAGTAVVYGIGVHPWWADAVKSGWEQRLREALTARPGCLVGEPPHPPPSLSLPPSPGCLVGEPPPSSSIPLPPAKPAHVHRTMRALTSEHPFR